MAVPILKSIHYISLYVFLGAPAFLYLMWQPIMGEAGHEDDALVRRNVRTGQFIGFVVFLATGAAYELATAIPIGYIVLKVALTAVAGHCWHHANGTDRKSDGLLIAGGVAASGGLLLVLAMLGDASGQSGIFPVVSHALHLLATVVWIGGLFYMATLPWKSIVSATGDTGSPVAAMVDRFTNLAFLSVAVVAATGAFASYVHVYTPVALRETVYGRTLSVKIGLFLLVLLIGAVNYVFVSPGLRRAGDGGGASRRRTMTGRFASLLRVQAVAVLVLLIATGTLTSLSSADTIGELTGGVWQLELDGYVGAVEMSAGHEPGELLVDLQLTGADGRPAPEGARVIVDMMMPDHEMGIPSLEADLIAPGHYRAHPVVSMEGEWEATIRAVLPGGQVSTASFEFEALRGARSAGQTRRLDPRAIFFEFRAEREARTMYEDYPFDLREFIQDFVFAPDERPLNFVAGLFWFVAAICVVVAALRRTLPRWVAPLGMIALGIGGYFLFSAMLVDAYPTAFVRNPVPLTSDSVQIGQHHFVAHCSVCHGPKGHGDGELAPFLDPPPEDLRERHVDFHPDGELFWWITHGIPGTEMPATESLMTAEERWHVVNFVRSFHREIPGGGATSASTPN